MGGEVRGEGKTKGLEVGGSMSPLQDRTLFATAQGAKSGRVEQEHREQLRQPWAE